MPPQPQPCDPSADSVDAIGAAVRQCRRCDLWRDAAHGVGGEGCAPAALMLVGEQPGDQEDLAGRPFVGPAGRILDIALARAGVDRAAAYVTNAVKHFKHERRGKRRLHMRPNAGEVMACRWWLDRERRLVQPRVTVALGATAAHALLGEPTLVGETRGRLIPLADGAQALVTVHPSYVLRIPDPATKARAFDALVQDLAAAGAAAGARRPL